MPPPTSVVSQSAQGRMTGFSLPCVLCSNEAAVPTTIRRNIFEIVNGRCVSCYKLASAPGHQTSPET